MLVVKLWLSSGEVTFVFSFRANSVNGSSLFFRCFNKPCAFSSKADGTSAIGGVVGICVLEAVVDLAIFGYDGRPWQAKPSKQRINFLLPVVGFYGAGYDLIASRLINFFVFNLTFQCCFVTSFLKCFLPLLYGFFRFSIFIEDIAIVR